MARSSLLGSATSFAHLLGRRPKAARTRAEDDEQEHREDDKDKDAKRGRAAEDDGDEDEDRKDKSKKGRAEDDDDDEARAAEEDDDEDEDDERDRKDARAVAARKRERARCAAIFGSKHAAGRVELAAHLAFNTSTGRRAAIALLKASPSGARSALAERMSGMERLRPGADAPRTEKAGAIDASWDRSAKRIGLSRR